MNAPAPATTDAPKRRRWLSLLLLLILVAGLWLALRQSAEVTAARRNIPAACIQMLEDMAEEEARARGVSLRQCASRYAQPNRRVNIIGRWVYGHEDRPVDGTIVHVRNTTPGLAVTDRLMHVSIVENQAVLNDLSLRGTECAGGIADVYVRGETFGMTVNLTSEALMRFMNVPALESRYRDGDLSVDANACAARLVMIDRRPVVIQLNPKPLTAKGAPAPAPAPLSPPLRQGCLDRLIAGRVAAGKAELAFPDEYSAFINDYVARCAAAPAKPAPRGKRRK